MMNELTLHQTCTFIFERLFVDENGFYRPERCCYRYQQNCNMKICCKTLRNTIAILYVQYNNFIGWFYYQEVQNVFFGHTIVTLVNYCMSQPWVYIHQALLLFTCFIQTLDCFSTQPLLRSMIHVHIISYNRKTYKPLTFLFCCAFLMIHPLFLLF